MGVNVHRTAVGVVMAVAMVLVGTSAAQAAWSAGAGSLTSGRYNHTATLLKDGRVLVAGGNNSGPLDSAALYDPGSNQWSNAAAMNVARHGHAAARLQSDKVLVAGGFTAGADEDSTDGYTKSAEVYDPTANTWSKVASMGAARYEPTMTVLKDGRVLVAGGSGDTDTAKATPLASAEIYDPEANSWSDVPSMTDARAYATATLLPDGDVLVAGGYNDGGELSSAEVYDASANTWSTPGSLAAGRDSAT